MTTSAAYILPGLPDTKPQAIEYTADMISTSVCAIYNLIGTGPLNRDKVLVDHSDLRKKRRLYEHIECKRITLILIRNLMDESWERLAGRYMLDHCTGLHHERKMAQFIDFDKKYAAMIRFILDDLNVTWSLRLDMCSTLAGSINKVWLRNFNEFLS